MAFNSAIFIFRFLPAFLLIYLLAGKKLRDAVLLLASIVFYLWAEPIYLPLLLIFILFDYVLGRTLEKYPTKPANKLVLTLAIGLNIGALAFFKVYTTYFLGILNLLTVPASVDPSIIERWTTHIPLGMSFFIFQIVSYLIDVYRGRCQSEKSLFKFALYVLMFPKIIAGPIVRYLDTRPQLKERSLTASGLANGTRRFVIGLGKKLLIADTLSLVVQSAFSVPSQSLTSGLAWLGIVCFTLQIYYDFSGYTDMAIGLGQMLGFKFIENFNYPYISKNISEFWRRWHISLSEWFRDYLFYPLERLRKRDQVFMQYFNIVFVFLMTGLWHGVTLNFVIWGIFHGLAIAAERGKFGKWLAKSWAPIRHLYAMSFIMFTWIFFRADSLTHAFSYIKALAGLSSVKEVLPYSVAPPLDHLSWLALCLGILFSVPIEPIFKKYIPAGQAPGWQKAAMGFIQDIMIVGLLGLSLLAIASQTHKNFLYMRF